MALVVALLATVNNSDDRIIKVIKSLRMACVMNVFIVHNTKTSTASHMRWKQNHFYRVPIRTSRTHRCCNEVKGFFFCQSPVAAFPGGRRKYEG